MYEKCRLCPRNCTKNRLLNIKGFCGESSKIKIACAIIHFGEEPPITGKAGSGTIFITGCTLQCVFCQNYQISQKGIGSIVSLEEFSDICLKLQEKGAENINIVTGSHAIPAIAQALSISKNNGLHIPILWNSSSYENIEALRMLEGIVDGWLPDLKTLDTNIAKKLFQAQNYPESAKKSILWMAEHSPLSINNGILQSGVIMRHLVIPGRLDDTYQVLKWFADNLQGKALLSLMTQFTPVKRDDITTNEKPDIDYRYINSNEFDELQYMLEELNIEDGFYQELHEDSSWLPDFNNTNPFPSNLAQTVWHWRIGFL